MDASCFSREHQVWAGVCHEVVSRRCRTAVLALIACILPIAAVQAGTPPPGEADSNLVPNSSFRGDFGVIGVSNGTVTGQVPTLWRAAAIDGGGLSLERQLLAPGALFPGSPATEAVKITVTSFGLAQVFDHANALFSIAPGTSYGARIYVRSGNADSTTQSFNFGMPFFDASTNFSGRDPSNFTATANSTWTAFDSPVSTVLPGEVFSHIAFRLVDDGGEDSIVVALPSVTGSPVYNIAPNPDFSGSAGAVGGMVSGTVPDRWRAFAVADNSLTIATIPLASGALYPGSPPTNAIRIEVDGGDGTFEGFDHEVTRVPLSSPYLHWGEVYMRSGNAASQDVAVSFPLFDASGTFTGQSPGSFLASVGTQWSLYAGPQFFGDATRTGNLGFRLLPNGAENSVLIALPRIVSPIELPIFRSGFEDG